MTIITKLKKRFSLFFICLVTTNMQAQVKDWYGSDLSRLGYKNSKIHFENAANGYANLWASNPVRKINAHSFEFSSDIFTKHVFFSFDGSMILDYTYYLFAKYSKKDTWWNNSEYKMDKNELIPTKLGFGFPVTKYGSLYVGGQYQYILYGIQPKNTTNFSRTVEMRGSQYGAGVHAVAAYKLFHFRYSWMYDWISHKKTGAKGMAMSNEAALHIGPAKFGGFIKLNHVFRKTNAYLQNTDKAQTNGIYKPSEHIEQFTISVGIFAAGLFSGVSHAVSKGVSDVETGLKKERDEDKKRKIEWVE